ncbi:MAG: FAD-dependent monooxygenase [Acidobacteriota bacterium]
MRILIQGGGIGGLALANLLERRRPQAKITIVEQTPSWAPLGAGITLTGNALRVLDAAELTEPLLQRGLPLESTRLADGRGRVLLEARPADGPTGRDDWTRIVLSIHRAALHETLVEGLERTTLLLGKSLDLESFTEGEALRLSDGTTVEADLVVGADGVDSQVRERVTDATPFRYAGYTCWRGVVDVPLHGATAWELWGGARRFGLIPLVDDRTYFYACINAPAGDPRYQDLDNEAFADLFEGLGGPVPEVLSGVRRDCFLHHGDLGELRLDRWHRDRFVLLGDAAHAMTPNLGQGAAMAIEDAAVLSEELSKSKPREAVARFEERRRPRVEVLQTQAFRMGSMAHWESRFAGWLRNRLVALTPRRVASRQMQSMVDAAI